MNAKSAAIGTAKDLFLTGLKYAHAMENQAHEMLERQAERMTDYPELQQRVTEHLLETKEQLARLEKCLANPNSSLSTIEDATQFGTWAISSIAITFRSRKTTGRGTSGTTHLGSLPRKCPMAYHSWPRSRWS